MEVDEDVLDANAILLAGGEGRKAIDAFVFSWGIVGVGVGALCFSRGG